jgi:hypothetical protein
MGPTAPLQLEKLSAEELLQHYCATPEEIYILALWERFMDRKNRKSLYWDLRWKARASSCPRGCNSEWLFLGSQTRAFFRFKRHIGQFAGRLDTPSFAAYKKLLVEGSIIDEYRFLTGQSKKIWVQIDPKFDVVDDMGNIVRTLRCSSSRRVRSSSSHIRSSLLFLRQCASERLNPSLSGRSPVLRSSNLGMRRTTQ